MNDNIISNDSILENNIIGKNVCVYKNAEVKNSNLADYVSIGDSSIIINTNLSGNNSINRRNYILNSDIGKFVYTGINSIIRRAVIGKFCSISWNVDIGGGDHPKDKTTTFLLERFDQLDKNPNIYLKKNINNIKSKCIIGNDVWIASNAVIIKNVKIGNGSIIGAGAVVTKDVEPYSIVAGVPAKIIRKRFDDSIVEILERIKWWDWSIDIIRKNVNLIFSKKMDENLINKSIWIQKR